MPNVRTLNAKKYGISKQKFLMAKAFCYQYPEWKAEIKETSNTVKSINISDMTVASGTNGDPTGALGMHHIDIRDKIDLVEETAKEAVGANQVMYPYLLRYVTEEGTTYNMLCGQDMPYGRTLFYETRRKFYKMISDKI
jgi:hypothetical protein